MSKRFVSIWFKSLTLDWLCRKHPELLGKACAVTCTIGSKSTITSINFGAAKAGVSIGMAIADARAVCPSIHLVDYNEERDNAILEALSDWAFRYTPIIAVNKPDGIILDVSGCTHLLGGEKPFLKDVVTRYLNFGYQVRAAMADTLGTAWAVARFAKKDPIVPLQGNQQALHSLPPRALRLDDETSLTLSNLGIRTIHDLMVIPRPMLTRRFGKQVVMRLDQALGDLNEFIHPKEPAPVYSVRLDILETISTAEAIAIGTRQLIEKLCYQLDTDQRGLREVKLSSYRVDGYVQHISLGTSSPSRNPDHIFRLFRDKLATISPGLGIELLILSANHTESQTASQEQLVRDETTANNDAIAELVDRLSNRLGKAYIYRFHPKESHIPENALETAPPVAEHSGDWPKDKLRPIHILQHPEPIEVIAPIPDYPPKQFKHRGTIHRIKKSDGPERIEAEWWKKDAQLRDYYRLEDEQGHRYWVYRLGHYNPTAITNWFIHGFFG